MAELVARRGHGVGGVVAQPQAGGGLRRHQGADVVDGDHGVEGDDGVVGDDRRRGPVGVVEGNLERARPHDPGQGVGLLGAHDHLDAEGPGRLEEVPGPVRGRGDEEE